MEETRMDTVAGQSLKIREGLTVWRRGDGTVVKLASNMEETGRLRREEQFLKALDGCGYTPKLMKAEALSRGVYRLTLEDLGNGEPVRDAERLRRGASRLLKALEDHEIQHGDLTRPNIIVRDGTPYAIDFGEARWFWEARSPKREGPDSFHLGGAIDAILEEGHE